MIFMRQRMIYVEFIHNSCKHPSACYASVEVLVCGKNFMRYGHVLRPVQVKNEKKSSSRVVITFIVFTKHFLIQTKVHKNFEHAIPKENMVSSSFSYWFNSIRFKAITSCRSKNTQRTRS
jgi:hypothetical protein